MTLLETIRVKQKKNSMPCETNFGVTYTALLKPVAVKYPIFLDLLKHNLVFFAKFNKCSESIRYLVRRLVMSFSLLEKH